MKRPKLLYASPFPPKQSGISDYSVVLVEALKKYFDISLFTDDYDVSDESLAVFPVLRYGKDDIDFRKFDYVLYNMGNNAEFHSYIYETALEHPGIVILHDYVLFHFICGYYKKCKEGLYFSVFRRFSIEEFARFREAFKNLEIKKIDFERISDLPMNTELLKSKNRFITHSEYARNKILATGIISEKSVAHVNLIDQVKSNGAFVSKEELFKKYNVPSDAVLVCAFGFIQGSKLNKETCKVIKKLNKTLDKKICYLMVGKGDYVDSELEDNLIIKTGFTEIDEFNSFVKYADIIVNLRSVVRGETSGSMLRILKMGKVCITNNGGWFSELPDDCVCKIGVDNVEDELEAALTDLLEDSERCRDISVAAQNYVEQNCTPEIIGKQMSDFIMQCSNI